eukprot:GHVT01038708.1.p1 GENE.GHVT01038708.1~~GHVT01038708.1.p1  ORF type:complete len:395 (-),score=72.14 GHVT01038708.1:208-1392(-)
MELPATARTALLCPGAHCIALPRRALHCFAPAPTHAAVGWFPDCGMSHVLARLRGSLGAYLALTGKPLHAADLIHSGLCRYWVAPEAVEFMELTSEKQLEVSEQDGKGLLFEHFLEPPDRPSNYSMLNGGRSLELTIHKHFNKPHLGDVVASLEAAVAGGRTVDALWARETLEAIRARPPLAAAGTFALLRSVRSFRHNLLEKAGITPAQWKSIKSRESQLPCDASEDSAAQVAEALEERSLAFALQLEMRMAHRFLMSPDLLEGLRAKLLPASGPAKFQRNGWAWPVCSSLPCSPQLKSVSTNGFPSPEILKAYLSPLTADGCEFDTEPVANRSEFPLSAHPLIRRLNPLYDPRSGEDHDVRTDGQAIGRWSDGYLQKDKTALASFLMRRNVR